MSRTLVTPRAFALLACSVLLVASLGCSPETPTAPSSTLEMMVESPDFIRILSTSSKGVQSVSLTAGFTSKLIPAKEGGVVSNGRVTLEFPPYALDEDTEITIDLATDGTLGVELGPHGIYFNRPVIMTMDLTGTTAEGQADVSSTLWFSEEQCSWEKINKVDSKSPDALSASLEHFSKFAGSLGG
jgi:hypothetical protein